MDQADPTLDDDADTAAISVAAVSSAGGGTSFTGFPGALVSEIPVDVG
jgi:hypothetical protein